MQSRTLRRSHDTDARGPRRERPLALGSKQPFGLQPRFEALELHEEVTEASGPVIGYHELVLPTGFVDGEAASDDVETPLLRCAQAQSLPPEQDAGQLAGAVLQGEVRVTRGGCETTRYLALHPQIGKDRVGFERFAYLGRKLTDRPDRSGSAARPADRAAVRHSWRWSSGRRGKCAEQGTGQELHSAHDSAARRHRRSGPAGSTLRQWPGMLLAPGTTRKGGYVMSDPAIKLTALAAGAG